MIQPSIRAAEKLEKACKELMLEAGTEIMSDLVQLTAVAKRIAQLANHFRRWKSGEDGES